MSSNPVVHWEMAARNVQKQQAFYAQLFGWAFDTSASTPANCYYSAVTTGGLDGAIYQSNQRTAWSGVYLTVEVPDVQAHLNKAVRLGAAIAVPVNTGPGGWCTAVIRDPEGNHIMLWKRPANPQ